MWNYEAPLENGWYLVTYLSHECRRIEEVYYENGSYYVHNNRNDRIRDMRPILAWMELPPLADDKGTYIN